MIRKARAEQDYLQIQSLHPFMALSSGSDEVCLASWCISTDVYLVQDDTKDTWKVYGTMHWFLLFLIAK